MGGQCGPGTITVPLKYIGSVPLDDLEVTASGDHIEDVGDEAAIFDGPIANLGNVAPGDSVVIMVRTDGTPGVPRHRCGADHRTRATLTPGM